MTEKFGVSRFHCGGGDKMPRTLERRRERVSGSGKVLRDQQFGIVHERRSNGTKDWKQRIRSMLRVISPKTMGHHNENANDFSVGNAAAFAARVAPAVIVHSLGEPLVRAN